MVTEECDWTSGLPGDWFAWHQHEKEVSKAYSENQINEKDLTMLSAAGKPHTESFTL